MPLVPPQGNRHVLLRTKNPVRGEVHSTINLMRGIVAPVFSERARIGDVRHQFGVFRVVYVGGNRIDGKAPAVAIDVPVKFIAVLKKTEYMTHLIGNLIGVLSFGKIHIFRTRIDSDSIA